MHRFEPRRKIAAWASAEAKARFSALAANRGLSESKLLGLVIDGLLARNPLDAALSDREERQARLITSACGYAPAMAHAYASVRTHEA